MSVRYLRNDQIDSNAWNKCIETSVNGNLFGYNWYLDVVSPKWEALVEDDYRSVMPLTYRWRKGLKILQHPIFSFSIGIYTNQSIDASLTERFINALPPDIKLVDFNLNKYNQVSDGLDYINDKESLLELDIIPKYDFLRAKYHPWLIRNLSNAEKEGYNCISGLQPNDLISLYWKAPRFCYQILSDQELKILKIITSLSLKSNASEIVGVFNNKNILEAAVAFIYSHNNVFLLFFAQSRESVRKRLIYMPIDFFIRKHSEKNITLTYNLTGKSAQLLDFKLFGSQITGFYTIYQNKMSWYFKPFRHFFIPMKGKQ